MSSQGTDNHHPNSSKVYIFASGENFSHPRRADGHKVAQASSAFSAET